MFSFRRFVFVIHFVYCFKKNRFFFFLFLSAAFFFTEKVVFSRVALNVFSYKCLRYTHFSQVFFFFILIRHKYFASQRKIQQRRHQPAAFRRRERNKKCKKQKRSIFLEKRNKMNFLADQNLRYFRRSDARKSRTCSTKSNRQEYNKYCCWCLISHPTNRIKCTTDIYTHFDKYWARNNAKKFQHTLRHPPSGRFSV